MITLNLEREDCRNAAELMETYFFDMIRDAEDLDNIDYVRSLIKCIDELNNAAGCTDM